MPGSGLVSWTVLGDDGETVEPVESYLAYLAALERSPNTQRAYATSLKLWFEFLDGAGVVWNAVDVDDVARFVARLRAPADNVIMLDSATSARAPATVGYDEDRRGILSEMSLGGPCRGVPRRRRADER